MGKTKGSGRKFWKHPPEQSGPTPPDSPYYRSRCDFCNEKGIYRWGKKVVCRAHMDELKADLAKSSSRWESIFGQYNRPINIRAGQSRKLK